MVIKPKWEYLDLKLNKKAFRAGKKEALKQDQSEWLTYSSLERLSAAWILSCRAHGLDPEKYHPIDKTKFSKRKRH